MFCYDNSHARGSWKLRSCQQILSRDRNNRIWLATWKYAGQVLLKKWEYQSRLAHTAHSWVLRGRETDEKNMKWVFIFNEKLKIKIDKIQQKLKWGHYILQLSFFKLLPNLPENWRNRQIKDGFMMSTGFQRHKIKR